MKTFKSRAQAIFLAIGTAHLLIRFHTAPGRVASHLRAPHAWVDQVGADTAVATLAAALLWLVALWLAIGMLAAVLAVAPGRVGATAAHLATVMIPATLRTMVATAAGAAMLVAPVPAFARGVDLPAAPSWPVSPATAAAPAWPTMHATAAAPSPAASGPTPAAPAWPTMHATTSMSSAPPSPTAAPTPPATSMAAGSALSPAPVPTTPHNTPQPAPPSAVGGTPPTSVTANPPRSETHPAPKATGGGDTVTVTPGDSLWLIAAHRLGPRATEQAIAVDWPHWYSANRAAIGSDPGLLHPGTTLRVPEENHPGDRPGGTR